MIKAIIIDDEEKARQGLALVLKKYCPQVTIVCSCESPIDAISKIKELQPDLLFLDVQMPEMSGFEMLNKIEQINFDVIFITAFDKYAIKAIKFSALDYLLKPINIEELVSAVDRISKKKEHLHSKLQSLLSNVSNKSKKITRLAIPLENEILVQPIKDIIYCKADSSYTTLHVIGDKKITLAKTLKDFENMLPPSEFCRIHHSTLVNIYHVEKYVKGVGGYVILSNKEHLDVSRRKKEQFLKILYET